jgi:protocatechuate 3,4-dioxygenase beta subunit
VQARPAAGSTPSGPASSLAGWSQFQIKKTAAEMLETARTAEDPQVVLRTGPNDIRMPPQQDVMRVATGVGYLQGADFGLDVTGFGKINGMQTAVSGFFTVGALGLQSRTARVSMFSTSGRWRGEGGDLYSDLGGLARGARVSWSPRPKWTPSLSLYLPRHDGYSSTRTALAYRDRYQLLPRVRIGGELTSEGATFLQAQYADPRLDLSAFSRFTRGPFEGRDQGFSAGLNVGWRVALSGALRLSDAASDSTRWQLASIRLPLPQHASVTLERAWWTGSADDGTTNAVVLQVPLGRVRLMQRLQWGRTDYRHRAVPFGFDRRQSQSAASYNPGPWGSVNYQQATQWSQDGRVQQWDEVASTFQVGRKTSLQFVTAFPDMWESERLRVRVSRQLSENLLLEAQYGRLSAFQLARASENEASRVMVTIRKTWQVRSPARGGDVRGRTVDQAGRPVAGALVRLGPYSAITDAEGGYGFTRVPDGDFELALDRNKLPVAYAWDEQPRALTVSRASRLTGDLEVIPLNAIRGRVYIDGNGNGRYDEKEGVPAAVVAIGVAGAVTATAGDGSYAFYNQPPGPYTIRLDVKRLAKGLAAVSPAERQVELTGDRPVLGVDFTVEKRDMPILMRELSR